MTKKQKMQYGIYYIYTSQRTSSEAKHDKTMQYVNRTHGESFEKQ